jgi:hypothetical protein
MSTSTSTSKYVVTKLSEEKIVDMASYIQKAIDTIDKFKTIKRKKQALTKLLKKMYEYCRDLIHMCPPLKEDLLSELPVIMGLDPEPDENSEFTKACNRVLAICKEPFVMEDEDAVCACRLSHDDDYYPEKCPECGTWFVGQCASDNLLYTESEDSVPYSCIGCKTEAEIRSDDPDLHEEADKILALRNRADGEEYDSDK